MSPLVILIGVIVLAVVLYMLYMYFFSPTYTLSSSAYLGAGPITVKNDKIPSQQTNQFNYSMWVYMNSWSSPTQKQELLTMSSSSKNKVYFKLYLETDETSVPVLKLKFSEENGSRWYTLSNSFPIQKWCYIVVNVDGPSGTFDSYLDGKLVLSRKQVSGFTSPDNRDNDSSVTITMGKYNTSSNPDVYLGNVQRSTVLVSPQEVWKTYSTTSVPTSTGILPSYNVQFSLFNDGKLQTQTTLL